MDLWRVVDEVIEEASLGVATAVCEVVIWCWYEDGKMRNIEGVKNNLE
jgi:hypothetical protein